MTWDRFAPADLCADDERFGRDENDHRAQLLAIVDHFRYERSRGRFYTMADQRVPLVVQPMKGR